MNEKTKTRSLLLSVLLLLVIISTLALFGCVSRGTLVVPRGWSGAATDNKTLYIGTMEGAISSVSLDTGRLLWTANLSSEQPSSGFLGCSQASTAVAIYGSPSYNGDLVYLAGYNGRIYAFSPGKNEPRWVYPRDGYIGGSVIGGTVFYDGNLYFGGTNGNVYALDAAEGFTVWNKPFETGDKIWSTPTISDGVLYIGSFDNKLYALETEDGTKKWEFLTEGAIVSQPVVYNGSVIIGSFDRNLYSVNAATGKENWRFAASNWFWAKPVIHNGTIYASCLNGKVYAINPATGNILTEFDLGSPISSSPVMVDDLLVVVATQETPKESKIYTIDTSNNRQKLLATLEEKAYSPLAASQDNVYVHTSDDILYEINTLSGAKREMEIKIVEEEE
jgi:outer membrane protein assembly factor BamB